MKLSYGIENLRTFEEMEPVELRPITILVGANSSGKSTFLRSISLLSQSLKENMEEPILWYKEGSVDFGDFNTSVKNNDSDREIKFKFKFQKIPFGRYNWECIMGYPDFEPKNKLLENVYYDIGIKQGKDKIEISSIKISVTDYNLSFSAKNLNNKTKILYKINDKIIDYEIFKNIKFYNKIFRNISYNILEVYNNFSHHYIPIDEFDEFDGSNFIFSNNILNIMNEIIESISDGGAFVNEATKIAYSYPLDENKLVKFKNDAKNSKIIEFYECIIKNSDMMEKIIIYSELNYILYLKKYMNNFLNGFFKQSTWVGPARVLDKRYYRVQGLDVSEISTDGHNLPMFLRRLKKDGGLTKFSDWIHELIGYQIDINDDTPNVEIGLIKEEHCVNLIDTGYGVSQILPILAQIWLNTIGMRYKYRFEEDEIEIIIEELHPVMMEQPELHLHPTHQAQIADALADSLHYRSDFSGKSKVLFVVETHSEALIMKLSALIREKKLSPDDVQVVVFSKATNKINTTEVTVSTFDEDGRLGNWPHRFFNYRS